MNQITPENQTLFENLVHQIQDQSGAVGIAVAIVDSAGHTQYQQFFGCRDQAAGLAMDEDTIFGLASVTKSFVALSIMQLAERGVISLDDPVSKYIPEFTNKNQETVLIRHFLSHSGGFYPVHRTTVYEIAEKLGLTEEKNGDLAFSDALAEAGALAVATQLDAQTLDTGLISAPGQYLSYCNDGFGLLSDIVRRVGGEASFADYVRVNILKPLGMDRSGADYLRPRLDPNSATLYEKENGVMTASHDYYNLAFVLGGAGAMKSTLADMKKLLTMYLNLGRTTDGSRLLSMEGIRDMCRPRIEYGAASWYCYGLSTKKLDDLTVIEHGGSLPGVSSNLSWSWDADAGIIVLCNTSGIPVSVIADAAMRMYHGRTPLPTRDLYQPYVWSNQMLHSALGTYVSLEDESLEISLVDDTLQLTVDGGAARELIPVQENLAMMHGTWSDSTVMFYKNEVGEVFAVRFGGRMMRKKI